MTEPNQTGDFATKVVKDSIAEVKDKMPKELSRFIRFTASAHVYSWVIRSEKTQELIAWLQSNGFKNITTDLKPEDSTAGALTTVTATADAGGYEGCSPYSCSQNQTYKNCNGAIGIYENPFTYNLYYYECYWNSYATTCYKGSTKGNECGEEY